MRVQKIVLVIILSTIMTFSYADKYTNGVNIESIESIENGNFIIIADRNITTAGCYAPLNATTFKVYIVPPGHPESTLGLTLEGAKNLLSVALSAFATSRPIDIYHGDSLNCLVSRIKINK